VAKSSPPSAPDPYQSAQAQYEYGTQSANYTTQLNRPDIITPYGSTTWSVAGNPGGYAPVEVPGYQGFSVGGTPSFALSSDNQAGNGTAGAYPALSYGTYGPYDPTGDEAAGFSGIGRAPAQTASGAPQYVETQSLSPAQQQLLDLQEGNQISSGRTAQAVAGQTAQNLSQPLSLQTSVAPTSIQGHIDTSGVPAIPGAGDLSGFTQQAQDAAYKQQTQYLDPQYQQEQAQLDSQLRNQGAFPGSAAYDNAMKLFTNQKQQAYESAANNAIAQGLNEQQALYGEGANTNQQLFGEAATGAQFANQAAGQQFGQNLEGAQFGNTATLQARDQPLSEYETLTQGTAAPAPSFGFGGPGGASGGASVQTPDIMSAFQNQYQGQLAGYNANVASQNADMGAAASLLAAFLMA
jgi:hypothetical protein